MDDQIAAAIEIVSQFQVIHLFRPENGYVEWKFVKTPQGLPKNSTFSHIAVGPQIARAMSRLGISILSVRYLLLMSLRTHRCSA